jgi:hypothetical protein
VVATLVQASTGSTKTCRKQPTEQGKTAPEKDNPGPLKSSFTGFIDLTTDRTLTGWAVLFAMGEHTSKEFLYDREHVLVWKCRKTGTKVRSKTGQKWVSRVQSRWVQNDEMSILPGSMVGEGTPKKGVKTELKIRSKSPKWTTDPPQICHGSAPVLQPLPQFYLFLNFIQ